MQDSADDFAKSLGGEIIKTEVKGVGDRVSHPAFGDGTIVGLAKNGNSYRIKFDRLQSERDISADFFNKRQETQKPRIIKENCEKTEEIKNDEYVPIEQKVFLKRIEQKQENQIIQEPEEIQKPDLDDYENLWKREDVPKSGWVCVGVTDLGVPCGVCEMCGHQIIRYVHHMEHPQYRPLGVGCICAGKMEGDIENAKKREQEFKSRQARKDNFKNRNWKISKNNNSYLKINDHLVVIYYNNRRDNWKYSLDSVFGEEVYSSKEQAMEGAFEALEKLK